MIKEGNKMLQINDCIKIIYTSALLLIMPGPTNTLLLCSGFSQGIIKSLKLILAECIGYLLSISSWGLLIIVLAKHSPLLLLTIKLISALYVAYLAVKIWHFSLQRYDYHVTTMTIFFTTLLNPKSFIFAAFIIPASAFLNQHDYSFAILSILFALLPISLLWTGCGASMPLWNTGRLFKPILLYRVASLAMFIFSISMLYNSVSIIVSP
ncbi:LysE family translocator [Xenorhabdus bovienii]|uniref:LysE family translocator n=1 Tax=Xenorhabdus bovienii TaxID=40576 RepID=UPI0023B33BD1|nr:hypothetical protein [Xenorhabdus bovienii]